ncbi:MAG: HDIG domain-containing protein [Ignavibacteria bacterium]|jgi:putative nucleotidyltransferase with HDIG domain
MEKEKNREYCLSLLKEYTKTDSLLKHAFAVEACVKAYAVKFNEDADYWGNAALLHDFDYEMFPSEDLHPYKGNEILKEKGFNEEFRNTILSHTNYTGVPRKSKLAKTLFACDELAGFILAVTYVRPSKSIDEVKLKSVKKKLKDKAFARAVNRDDIYDGVADMEVELDEHIEFCINALKENKELLGI